MNRTIYSCMACLNGRFVWLAKRISDYYHRTNNSCRFRQIIPIFLSFDLKLGKYVRFSEKPFAMPHWALTAWLFPGLTRKIALQNSSLTHSVLFVSLGTFKTILQNNVTLQCGRFWHVSFRVKVWRAVRLVVDTGLHYRGMTRWTKFCWLL